MADDKTPAEEVTQLFTRSPMDADTALAVCPAVSLTRWRDTVVRLEVYVDNGAGGEPTDEPVGDVELWLSHDESTYVRLTNQVVDTLVAPITPVGRGLNGKLALHNVPGRSLKVRYRRKSGGGGDSRMDITAVTFERFPFARGDATELRDFHD